jgi:hypothetical protein
MMLPADIVNRSLNALGIDMSIGAFSDGTRESEAARRIYLDTLRQLLRGANWNFARKMAGLQLLGDSSGQTLDPIGVPISTNVEPPWLYAYAWPTDGVKARWLPWNMIPPGTAVPPMTNIAAAANGQMGLQPARFLVSSSDQFPSIVGQTDWDNLPDPVEGAGLINRRIVLTNVPNAMLVYTKLTLEIEEWDSLFTEAMVALLASRLAMIVIDDKKLAITERAQQIAIAKESIAIARTANANDAGFPQSVNHEAVWIKARVGGTRRWGGAWDQGGFPGYFYQGWDSVGFADGSVY